MSNDDEEIWAETSDDERYNPAKYKKGTWEPKPDDILKIFEEIKTKKVLELQWQCPGRRSPDSEKKKTEEVKVEPKEEEKEEEKKPEVTQFDFDDEGPEPKTVMTPRRTPGSAPKSEKKVARMDKVLKDMMYQRKLQAAEKEARKLAFARSPRAPGSPGRVRLGSPAGSPRTPPVHVGRTQSPVRAPGPGDGLPTTPLRAPITADSVVRTTVNETIAAAAPKTETVAMDTNTKGNPNISTAVTAIPPARTLSGAITPPIKNILSGEASLTSLNTSSVTPVVTPLMTPVTALVTTSISSSVLQSVMTASETPAMTSAVTSANSQSEMTSIPLPVMTSPLTSQMTSSLTTVTSSVLASVSSAPVVVSASGNTAPVSVNVTVPTLGEETPTQSNENKPETPTPTAMDTS